MLKTKQQLTVLIFGIFLFAGAILPVTAFAQDYEDSPFCIHPADPLDAAQDLGVHWNRPWFYVHWPIVQKSEEEISNGIYHWDRFDNYYEQNMTYNIDLLVNLSHVWSGNDAPYALDSTSFLPYSETHWTNFVRAVVERYDGDGNNDAPSMFPI